jgi:hypothetical protein
MAIRKLLRENAALVVGVTLPVVVVVFFLLATYIPRLLVDPPRYDFLFAQENNYSNQPSRWRHEIDIGAQRQLRVRAFLTEPDKYIRRPRLFRYEHLGGNVREISLPLPETAEESEDGIVVEISEFANQAIDTRRIAPDGYELLDPRSSRGFLVGVFYKRGRRDLAIAKDGAVVAVPSGDGSDWHNVRFLGWIVTPPDQ